MKLYILDTNCLLSYVTDRNIIQQNKVDEIFYSASKLEQNICIISDVITEFIYVLDSVYKTDKTLISSIVSDLLKNPGVVYNHGYYPDRIFELWPKKLKDYGDAVIASCAKEMNSIVYTFDKKFANLLNKLHINCRFLC